MLEHALLVLTLEVNPTTVLVGDTASITVTIRNTTGRTATDVVVTLPAPAESVPVPAPAYQPAQRHWQWTLPHLAAFESHSMTAQVRVVRLPDGAALVATAAAIGTNSPRQTVTGGALVAARPPDGRGATARFVPGQRAVLDRSNERIKVTMSGGAARQPLSLRARTVLERRLERPTLGHIPALNHGRQGIATYFLDATTDADTAVHDFAAPVTITLAYTPEQVTALGLAEADLTIFWLDESLNQWIPQPTVVDPIARTVTTVVTHFSAYQLGDGSKPSDAFIPSLQGWQVGMYTGGVSYSYPIEVPAGPAGVKPALDLSYSSSASDGAGGTRLKQQAACSMVFRLRPQRLFSADDLGGSGGGGLNNKGTLSYGYLSDQAVRGY